MKLVIFGLTISSSWGNGHATIWRSLCRQLINRGHDVVFFERDVPYYAAHRDLAELPGGNLRIYSDWQTVTGVAQREVRDADVAITTSYYPDAIVASELIWDSAALRIFYDLDTPVTLSRLRAGELVPYIHPNGLSEFDLVLSFTGGEALNALQRELGARQVAPLYGSVDPDVHRPVAPNTAYQGSLSYLGTYSVDRDEGVRKLFLEAARLRPADRFILAGAQYPPDFPWGPNIFFVRHLAPDQHPTFYCSSRLTLNVTRSAMRAMGWCPSGRLFEAAACGVPVISDWWEGLDEFFRPGAEILTAVDTADVNRALQFSDTELQRIATAARERTLAEHTGLQRTIYLEQLLDSARTQAIAA
ncbi:MAG: glycosyltransferase [Chthoniobacterales bacterium]